MSSKLLTVLSIVAVVCVAGLLAMQGLELMYYGSAPSVWPR